MPITKSAKKALRQSLRRKEKNLEWKIKMKEFKNKIEKLVKEKKIEEAKKLLPQYYKTMDKAAKNNIIKKNNASRKKSRLTKFLSLSEKKLVEKSESPKPTETKPEK